MCFVISLVGIFEYFFEEKNRYIACAKQVNDIALESLGIRSMFEKKRNKNLRIHE